MLAATLALVVIKAVVSTWVILGLGLPYRVSVLTGLDLSQTGEFSLLLLSAGLGVGFVDEKRTNSCSPCVYSRWWWRRSW